MITRYITGAMFAILGGFLVVRSGILDGATVVVSALLIAFGVGASGRAVTWLTYALALGTVGVSFAGLSLNEVANWRLSVGLGNLRWLPGRPLREPAIQQPRAA